MNPATAGLITSPLRAVSARKGEHGTRRVTRAAQGGFSASPRLVPKVILTAVRISLFNPPRHIILLYMYPYGGGIVGVMRYPRLTRPSDPSGYGWPRVPTTPSPLIPNPSHYLT